MPSYVTALDISKWMGLKFDQARGISVNVDAGDLTIDMGLEVANYSIGDSIRLFDNNHPMGELLVVSDIDGTELELESGPNYSYTKVASAKVQNQCHFTPMTIPAKEFIDEIIDMNEAVLDRDIHTSYRPEGLRDSEWITHQLRGSLNYPYLSMPLRYPFDCQTPLELKHRGVHPLDPTQGDKIEIAWGEEWKDILDKENGYKIWEDIVDTLSTTYLSRASPITCEFTDPRLTTPFHWSLTHENITAFSLVIIGIDVDGNSKTETFTQANGWKGYTANFFRTITSITFTRTTGSGSGDVLTISTKKDRSRASGDYDGWVDYEHGIFYPKSIVLQDGLKSSKVTYRHGHYYMENQVIPLDVKKAALLLTAIDIVDNERYAVNLPGNLQDSTKAEVQVNKWLARYKELMTKRRETPARGYQ